VIWRRQVESTADDRALRQFFIEQGYNLRPAETALNCVYVNGDCTLAALRADGDQWDELLTEEAFKHLMFQE